MSWGSPVKALPGQRAPPLLAARASSLERVCAPTTGSGSYKALCVKFSDCRGRGQGVELGVAWRISGLAPRAPPASSTCLLRRSTEWATPTRGGPAEPIPGTTPHLALEQETGGPNLSSGLPGAALPKRRAPLYLQHAPLPLSTDGDPNLSPNMSRGSPGKTLPGRRAAPYQQRTPLPLSTDWAAPN